MENKRKAYNISIKNFWKRKPCARWRGGISSPFLLYLTYLQALYSVGKRYGFRDYIKKENL